MTLEWRARSTSLAWSRSNPVAWWWGFLSLTASTNIALWFWLYRELLPHPMGRLLGASAAGLTPPADNAVSAPGLELMLLLCAAYVFGCAFRSFLPRADVQRICLFDTWLSSVTVGRSVATVAEIAFAAQWVIILRQLGAMTGAETTWNVAAVILPLIVVAECFSWYAVLTKNFLFNAIENSLWAVAFFAIGVGLCRLLPEFDGPVRWALIVTVAGIVGYLAFLMAIDVPMYFNRWRADRAGGIALLTPLAGLHDASTRWVVTRDFAAWKDEIAWMSLYFSAAVWASLALCVVYAMEARLPQYRVEASVTISTAGVVPALQR